MAEVLRGGGAAGDGGRPLPAMGAEDLFRAPWVLSDTAVGTGLRGPFLGEHNDQVAISN